jgi:hypothetical protein
MSTPALATAMAKAQAEIKTALKDSKNPHFKSSYADLTSVWDACRGALTKHGLSVVQIPGFDANDVWLETMILHASGESISGRYPLRPAQNTPQGYGSALTYARRYSLAAMVGVVADEDDDGNAASVRPNGHHHAEPQQTAEDKADAAKLYVENSLVAIGQCLTIRALEDWTAHNAAKIARLTKAYPDEAIYVTHALKTRREAIQVNG